MALRGSLWPATPDTRPLQDGPTGLGLPLHMSPQLTGQVSLRGIFLPPDGKLIDLELPVIRHVLVLIPNGLGLVLLEVLQGPKHPWAWLRLKGLGAGTDVDWSVRVHMAQLVPHHSATGTEGEQSCRTLPDPTAPSQMPWAGEDSAQLTRYGLALLAHARPLLELIRVCPALPAPPATGPARPSFRLPRKLWLQPPTGSGLGRQRLGQRLGLQLQFPAVETQRLTTGEPAGTGYEPGNNTHAQL